MLRSISIKQLVERDTPGYAIGGLAGGESKDDFWRMVAISTAGESQCVGRGGGGAYNGGAGADSRQGSRWVVKVGALM